MGLVGYSDKVLGNIVDIAFRDVIWFYWLQYKSDAYLSSWTLTVQ